jgi:hypothetical protein
MESVYEVYNIEMESVYEQLLYQPDDGFNKPKRRFVSK